MIIQQCRLKASATLDHVTAAALAEWTATDQQTSLGLSNGPTVSSDPFDAGISFTASEVAEWPRQSGREFMPAVIMTPF